MVLLGRAAVWSVTAEEGTDEVARAGVMVQGQRREDGAEVYVVVEVAWGVGPHDVERAVHRAALLVQLGTPSLRTRYDATVRLVGHEKSGPMMPADGHAVTESPQRKGSALPGVEARIRGEDVSRQAAVGGHVAVLS